MELSFLLLLTFFFLPLQIWCQTIQDNFTAPAVPDGSTLLQSGTKFTLIWKSSLPRFFGIHCPSCDTRKVDLWIRNFNGTTYATKIGRGIDLTTTTSYDWNVNIASNAFSDDSLWVFRFTLYDADYPPPQEVSSPGFKISGLVEASSTQSKISSIATTSTSATSSGSSAPTSTEQVVNQSSSSKSKTWISGVVVGPLIGIALGAAFMWYCLHKRKNKKIQQNGGRVAHSQAGSYQQYPLHQNAMDQNSQSEMNSFQSMQHQSGNQSQYIVETPGATSPSSTAELSQGNYR
ncbi:hypothetical protein BU24DRAFT_481557 [Aaosphaeria arxii CBS 175.79]|uniref:Mid2 domain-containing protein n=1 Tax=Aaosphaeria arxii CBS 175.79 TaxID=1450172 RepID=A0A6A5XMQ9_9PLEO|nr:uncharacterized protein BU24DRAFT_481557 [Aaosphaeria arxii CBS 175.79]KAF2014137.1 hypothetical protein BU24DRAFT_481557 [Aaosphaeria arxii CBS 175.79]